MTWDASFETWSYYGVRGQPVAMLVTAKGEPVDSWVGRLPIDEVMEALEDL